ncbi:MAG TPA: hypothetical protein VNO50_07935 [Pyrinomonadaceae bacterium]|nr:hypothetical protein [Pyrinomonadaceae bacterium]
MSLEPLVRRKGISGRTLRVVVYTSAILVAPMPVMWFARGTREFALAVIGCGTVLTLGSFYVAAGEFGLKQRSLLGNKLLASSIITLLFGLSLVVGSIIYLGQS